MHPRSDYHLAFNLGFPNQHDRNIGATGSNIMIHGGCASVGCFAMTDYYMEQLWVLAGAAFQNGQDAIDVHVLPFRFNERNVLRHSGSEHWPFWASLQPLDRYFEEHGWPARVAVDEIGYRLVDARSEQSGHDRAAAP
jgi:murein L,D-transpeptidase YafK